jgi:branched-chain amino acid transport system permease protein
VEIPRVVTDNWEGLTRGSLGLVGLPGLPGLRLGSRHFNISESAVGSYYFVLGYGLVLLLLVALIIRSNLGLALQAIRQEETAAASLGIRVQRYRLLSLLLSAIFTGITGACYAHVVRYIEPGLVYGLHFSAVPMIFAICGGRFTIIGPVLAALFLYPLDQFIFHPLFPAGHQFLYGLVIILAVVFMPSGFWGQVQKGNLVSVKTGSIE